MARREFDPVRRPREPFRGTTRERSWNRLSHGLYWPAEKRRTTPATLKAWALVLPPNAAFTHLTSASLRGWWQVVDLEHPLFAAVPEGTPVPHRSGLWVSRHPGALAVETIDGVRVTTAAETLLSAARDLSILDLVVLGDSALRSEQCTIEELRALAAERRRGAPRLRRIIPMLDTRSESPWESIMRVLHRAADIPVEPQYKIYDENGTFLARVDLWIEGTRRVHEYDGGHHREPEEHRRDLLREGKLVNDNWQRIGYVAAQLIYDGAGIIAGADRLLGRRPNPNRLKRWQRLLDESTLRPAGRARVLARWWRSPSAPRAAS